jgi:hypothetical protein
MRNRTPTAALDVPAQCLRQDVGITPERQGHCQSLQIPSIMRTIKLDQLIDQLENYVECWKQFNRFLNLGREKRFSPEEDTQFLEVKSVLIQQLELILASIEVGLPTREDVHALVGSAPSLRYLSELSEGALRNLENQWHKIYIAWHAILGRLKVRQRIDENRSAWATLFG